MMIPQTLTVLNIGAELFAEELRAQGVTVTSLAWTPPATEAQAVALAITETLVDPATEQPDAGTPAIHQPL